MNCGLLGRKLGHSYSPQIHSYLGNYSYDLFEKEPEDLPDFIRHGNFTGINVTIPYKKDVIPFLDELSATAKKMQAVNTIVRRADGSLFGHNTDCFGFTSMVRRSGIPVSGQKVLVLGSGGTSNTAVKALEDLGAQVVVISRSGENNYSNLSRHFDARVIVNTTPVGMYPNNGASAVDLRQFPRLEGVLDVIYNPARTKLLLDAEQMGIPHENGLWMLVAQAKESAEYFTGRTIDDSVIASVHRKLAAQMENIILIGMPGCGKSTVGRLLADLSGKQLVDADARIQERSGMSIPEIFAQEGEAGFRKRESQILEQLGKQSGQVIATGGGCVTESRNYRYLRQNGRLYWLRRDISLLPRDGRPLSQAADLRQMYALREPMYRQFADAAIDNNGSIRETVETILSHWEEAL